jgi:hypothetical protein
MFGRSLLYPYAGCFIHYRGRSITGKGALLGDAGPGLGFLFCKIFANSSFASFVNDQTFDQICIAFAP